MMRRRALLRRGLRSILARPGRTLLAAFGIGLGVAAALQLLGAIGTESPDSAPRPAAPTRIHRLMVSAGERESLATLWSTTPAEALRAGLRAGEGRMLGELDQGDARRVAVLGAGVRAELFGFGSGLLETIQIGASRFTVIGVLEPTLAAAGEIDPNRALLLSEAAVAAHLGQLLPGAAPPSARAAPSLLGAVAAIALLLGGSALASAMFATVIERGREIALRLVVGATRRDVFTELLLESVLVSTLGGLVGIVGALAVEAGAFSGVSRDLVVFGAPLTLALAALVGAAAGLLPALRAAAVDPLRTLRSS
jgi:ABC-type antimicrobial peptide transport system permease subunit